MSKKKSEPNALSVISKSEFAALGGENVEMAEALETLGELNLSLTPNDLTRVKVPAGGATQWEVPTPFGPEYEKEIEGLIVHQQQVFTLWESEEPVEGRPPVLMSYDGITAMQVADDIPDNMIDVLAKFANADGTYDIREKDENGNPHFPFAQFGSSEKGPGKRMKENRILFILRADDMLPIAVNISPGSLGNCREFLIKSTLSGIPYYRSVVGLTLAKETNSAGQGYAQVNFALKRILSREEGAEVREKYRAELGGIARQVATETATEPHTKEEVPA